MNKTLISSEVEKISQALAIIINSRLKLFEGNFSQDNYALCLSVYVEYAFLWLRPFFGEKHDFAPNWSVNIIKLSKYAGKSLFDTEVKLVDDPLAFIECFDFPKGRHDSLKKNLQDLGVERKARGPAKANWISSGYAAIKNLCYRLFADLLMTMARGVVFLDAVSRWEAIKLSMYCKRPVIAFTENMDVGSGNLNIQLRSELCSLIRADDSLSEKEKIVALIALCITSVGLLEDFNLSFEKVSELEKYRPEKLVFCLAPFYSPVALMWIAILKDRDCVLYGIQHGGYYGEGAHSWAYRAERRLSDRYLTFGWSYAETDIPIESIRLSRALLKNKHRRIRGRVIVILENLTALSVIAQDSWKTVEMARKIKTIGMVLKKLISDRVVDEVYVRMHPVNRCRWQVDAVATFLPFAKTEAVASGMLSEHTLSAEVCVFDCIGSTGALECLSQDTPIAIFEPAFKDRVCVEAYSLYDMLGSVNMVATDAATLEAGVISGIEFARGATGTSYESAFLAYKDKHARASNEWLKSYGKVLAAPSR